METSATKKERPLNEKELKEMYEMLLPGSKLKEGSYTYEDFLAEIDRLPPPENKNNKVDKSII